MIIEMVKVRIFGPRERLPDVLRALQDAGTLHLAAPDPDAHLPALDLTPIQSRERRHLRRALDDVEKALDLLALPGAVPHGVTRAGPRDFARWARLGSRVRRSGERLLARAAALDDERALILKYQHFFSAFRALLESESAWPNAVAYHVLLRRGDAAVIARLRGSLTAVIGDSFQLFSQPLPTGEVALLVVVSSQAAGRVERLLAEAQVQEIPVPERYGGRSLTVAVPKMMARLTEIPAESDAIRREREALGRSHGDELRRARLALHDRLCELEALPLSGVTARAFVLEGWVPAGTRRELETSLHAGFGDEVVVTVLSSEEWESAEAPVVLRNPRLLRPFEELIALMPLPAYGTVDPTPFVAVFFPAFFGIMMGDLGYGALLALTALILHHRARPGSRLGSFAEIGLACALFSVIAGALYGELFGDLGRRAFGLRPLAFGREEALIPFLLLAVSLGVVHILVGLCLGVAANIRRHPRQALGRGVSALMVVLIIVALLASFRVLPRAFFTPSVVTLLAAFPVLILTEGLVAPIELLGTLGNVLSYARIMALGVASVMFAVVANRMVGATGSVAVGVVFALLFHLVNFAIALFSSTIHALRLHYVEFFGKFYSPGGVRYEPFGHWTREQRAHA